MFAGGRQEHANVCRTVSSQHCLWSHCQSSSDRAAMFPPSWEKGCPKAEETLELRQPEDRAALAQVAEDIGDAASHFLPVEGCVTLRSVNHGDRR